MKYRDQVNLNVNIAEVIVNLFDTNTNDDFQTEKSSRV